MEQKVQSVADLVKRLPMKLRVGLRVEVLHAAVEEGFLTVTAEGKLVWLLESKTLLAYFCGRMWCGDTPLYSPRARGWVWQSGQGRFPRKDLVALFGVRNLRTLREQRYMGMLPVGWELVEKVFKAAPLPLARGEEAEDAEKKDSFVIKSNVLTEK